MNKYIIKSKGPNCKTCGKPMREWNPFATEHEHPICTGKRIADKIINNLKSQLK